MAVNDESPGLFGYRLGEVERAVEKKADKDAVAVIADEVRNLRRNLIQFMIAISGSVIVLSYTLLNVLPHK